jgi:hypothetical protein
MGNQAKHTTSLGQQEMIEHKPAGEAAKSIGSSFFRGETCNFNPYLREFAAPDFLERFLLKGWLPEAPFVTRDTRITAFGSCFATNITKYLSRVGYSLSKERNPDIYISSMGEGLVNVHALAEQFEWALGDHVPPEGLWHGFKAEEFGYSEDIRVRTREAMLATDFFIITLGLSEVWYDEVTGGIFWRAVPMANYDASRHKFRVCSFAETKARLESIYALIRAQVPGAKVLFTLSPVPLAATFRPASCITANSASKAILRAALDEFLRDHAGDLNTSLFYFPSHEVVTDLFFSKFGPDGRHPHDDVIELIMQLFESIYCVSDIARGDVARRFIELRKSNAQVAVSQAG